MTCEYECDKAYKNMSVLITLNKFSLLKHVIQHCYTSVWDILAKTHVKTQFKTLSLSVPKDFVSLLERWSFAKLLTCNGFNNKKNWFHCTQAISPQMILYALSVLILIIWTTYDSYIAKLPVYVHVCTWHLIYFKCILIFIYYINQW